MRKKLIFLIAAVLLLAPWPVAYAYDNGGSSQETINVQAAPASARPTWTTFHNAIGGVGTPGDLFYIDALDSPADLMVTVYLTNTAELTRGFRYLTLQVNAYTRHDTEPWQKATALDGKPVDETYLTMLNGQVSFTLSGYAQHKISIDSGSFYSFGGSEELAPKFFIEVTPQPNE